MLRERDDALRRELAILCRKEGAAQRLVLQVTTRSAELITVGAKVDGQDATEDGDLLHIRKAFTLRFEMDRVRPLTRVYPLDMDREDISYLLLEDLRELLGCEQLEPTQPGDLLTALLEGRT